MKKTAILFSVIIFVSLDLFSQVKADPSSTRRQIVKPGSTISSHANNNFSIARPIEIKSVKTGRFPVIEPPRTMTVEEANKLNGVAHPVINGIPYEEWAKQPKTKLSAQIAAQNKNETQETERQPIKNK
jgi:hypothetical protein